ncbi:MAG: chemotaxis protein CheW [Desulfobacterales bacterium]|nr:chemotaxis protein CheW [Desulfobacterales bacterium]
MMQKEDRCWKRIGVWGKEEPRCPELKQVIHCRNCDLFTQAGRNLLERDLPDEYMNEWGQVLLEKKGEEPIGMFPVVTFRIEGEWLALPAQLFAEIIDMVSIHSLPHRKRQVLQGVVNVHGEIHICVSLEHLIGLEKEEEGEEEVKRVHERMMVVSKDGDQWVFAVKEVHGIHHVHPSLFQNVPVTIAKSKSAFTKGIFTWQDKHVALLDDEILFYTLKRSIQ